MKTTQKKEKRVRKRGKRFLKTAALILTAAGFIAGARLWYVQEQGNFHTVTKGEAYRSAQLDTDGLNRYIKKYGIRSIVNLRGEHISDYWYQEEIRISNENNVRHYDLRLDASKSPDREQINRLISIFRSAERPVLLHCKAGADRAGLASAIWLTVIDGRPKSEADDQLSIKYGHMPVGPTQAMDRFFSKWEPPVLKAELSF